MCETVNWTQNKKYVEKVLNCIQGKIIDSYMIKRKAYEYVYMVINDGRHIVANTQVTTNAVETAVRTINVAREYESYVTALVIVKLSNSNDLEYLTNDIKYIDSNVITIIVSDSIICDDVCFDVCSNNINY